LCVVFNGNKTKKNTTLSELFQTPIEKSEKEAKIYTHNTHIYDRSLSWLGTCKSIKSGGV